MSYPKKQKAPFFMGKLVLYEKQSKGGDMRYGAMNFPVRPVLQELKEIAALESLTAIVRKAEDLGLTLCIENMFAKTHMLVEPDDFEEIFKRFPSLKLTLDTGHANIKNGSGKRIFELISRFSGQLGHVHVSDNFGKEDNHLPIGTGTVDFSRVADSLKNVGYDDTVTFEIFSRDRNYLGISRQRFQSMLESTITI